MSPFTPETPVREILHRVPQTLGVLERHHLDYCCGGARPLREACVAAGADLGAVLGALEAVREGPRSPVAGIAPEALGPKELVAHVLSTHHAVTREASASLPGLARKVARVHGRAHPELARVAELVETLFHELSTHMEREEQVLFPYIVALAEAEVSGGPAPRAGFGTAARPIHVMRMDHDAAGALLGELAEVTGHYAVPAGACTSWRALYEGLDAHQRDLMRHVWIENELLFPAAIDLEERLLSRRQRSA